MIRLVEPGEEVALTYPISTHCRFWRPWEVCERELVIHRVRDLVSEPLSVEEYLRRPYLLRSRWLVRAYEPRHRRWRQFYLGSSVEFRAPSVLRVGLYEPEAKKPSQVLGRGFEATCEDRNLLTRALKLWNRHDFGEAKLRVFATDTRLIG